MKKYLLLITFISYFFGLSAQRNQLQTYEAENIGYFITPIETPSGIIFTDNLASKIYLLKKNKVETLVSSAGCGRYFTVSSDGSEIGYKSINPDGKQAPYIINLKNKKISQLHSFEEKCGQPSFSDNNVAFNINKIFFFGSKSVQNLTTSNIAPVSPDGNFIVYDVEQKYFILYNIKTGINLQLPNDGKGVIFPKWSPDSKKILFQNRNTELFVYEVETKQLYKIGKGGAGNWDKNSENIVFQKTEASASDFILKSSDIFISDFRGKNIRQITFTDDVFEMTPSFDLQDGILYQTYDKRQIIRARLNASKSVITTSTILLDNPQNFKPEFYDVSKFSQAKSITHLTDDVPYIHQKYDAPTGRNGGSACAPTTSNMALAYYNRLPKWPESATSYTSITGKTTTDYGGYVLDRYKYNEFSFDAYSSSKNAYGGYAYMWISPYTSPGGGDGMRNYQNLHDMASGNYVWTNNATFTKTQTEINNEYPQPICSWITQSGHLTLCVGYVNNQHTLIMNDPWGNKNTPGYPSYDGKDSYYDWPGYNNGYQNFDPDGSHGTVAWTLTARSSQPVYDDLTIQNIYYNHGFYMNNTIGGAKQRYYRHVKNAAGSNGHIWWTGGEGGASSDVCWVSWTPNLSNAANYRVEVYIPATFTDNYSSAAVTSSAYYKIYYDGGNTSVTVNQLANQGSWVNLGTYQFQQGQNGYVRLGDAVASADNGKKVLFDAVRFTQIAGSPVVSSTNVTCTGANDGTATVTTSPGPAPYTYLWSPGGQTTSSVSGLSAGNYSVSVTDGNSTTYQAGIVIEEASELLSMTTSHTDPTSFGANDGTITANVTGGVEPYSYVWIPNVSTSNYAQNLSAGTYTIDVTDAYGCTKQTIVTLADPVCTSCCVLLSEDFTEQALPSGWQNVVNSGGNSNYVWKFNNPAPRTLGGNFDADFAILDADDIYDDIGVGKANASLITPAINCTGRTDVRLEFDHKFVYSSNTAVAKVEVSNDGTNWSELESWSASSEGEVLKEYDISAYAANKPTVYIKWTYTEVDAFSNYWAVDNIKIYAPPAGTKTISANGGDYTNFTEAINAINTCGIGTGGITFLVAADEVFTEDPPVITAIGDATKPVIFLKSGTGANPIIKATGTASSDDAAIKIAGGDYFTFDGIDIQIASGSALEYGYYLYNVSATDGSQHNTIKNCSITLNSSNESSKGIFQNIQTGTIDPTSSDGANSFNDYENISISNAYHGIDLFGYDLSGQDPFYDDSCVVTNCTISGFGLVGATTDRVTGILTWSQKNLSINNNIVYNGISDDKTLGIYCAGNNTGNIFGNNVYGLYGEGIQVVGIREYNSSMKIYRNEVSGIEGVKMATGIEGYGGTSTAYNNFVYDVKAPTGNSVTNGYPSARGISFRYTTGTQSVFYNSVYIAYYSSNAGNESTAFYLDNSTADLRNNIFENNTDATTGTRATVLYFKGSSDLANLSINSNNNCCYNGVATSKYALAYDAGNSVEYLDLTSYAASSPGDANSIEENPPFKSTSAPYDLHINPNISTVISNGGVIISGFNSDFDGDLRNATTPDIGADEYDTGSPLCGTYTIDNTVATDGTNFNSFTDAINTLNDRGISCSVIFNVHDNQIFSEDIPSIEVTGTSANTVTFQKAGTGANPIIKPTGTSSAADFGICLNGVDYYTFDGIDISILSGDAVEFGYYLINASETDGAQHNLVKNCTITLNNSNSNSVGVIQLVKENIIPTNTDGANSFNIYDNITVENAYSGFKILGYDVSGQETFYDDAVEIKNCSVNNFGQAGVQERAVGILTWSQKNLLIHNNTITNGTTNYRTLGIYAAGNNQGDIYNNTVYGLYGTGSQVVGLRQYESTVNFYNNEVYDIEGVEMASGIEIYGGTSYIYNNFVRDIRTPGTDTYNYPTTRGISNRKGTAYIYNNSVLLNYISTAATNESAGIFVEGFNYGSATADIRNNIVVNKTDVSTGAIAAALYKSAEYATISTNSDNNLYYAGTPSSKNLIYYDTNVADRTLSDYKIRCVSYEQNSITEDAPFVSNSDLHIQTSAITYIDGGGQTITYVTDDFDGDTRDVTVPDIGADEFNCDYIVWRGTTDTNWATASNWQKQQVPTINDNTVIPDVSLNSNNFPIITTAGETNDLTIYSGANLQINSDYSLTVNGTMDNQAGITGLIIKSDASGTGSFINSTANVSATVERFLNGTQWHYLASPIIDAPLSLFNTNNFYYYNETTDDSWSGGVFSGTMGWTAVTSPNLTSFEGYAYYFTPTTLIFEGNLHTGTYTSPELSWTNTSSADQYEGWHLLGNPYPSALDWNSSGISFADVDKTVYFYDDDIDNYCYYNISSGGVNGGTQYIPAMQGFFVHCSHNNAQLQITNETRVHNTTDFYKKSAKINFPYFTLKCSGNNRTDEIKTVINENATFKFDADFDAYKMYIQTSETPFIYFYLNNIETAINTIPTVSNNLVIPLGLSAINADNYKISLSEVRNIDFPIYLYDKKLGNVQNITENPEYTFSYSGGNTADRFEILFSEPTDINENNNDFVIFPNPANTYVKIQSNKLKIESLELTDITGKVLLQKNNTNKLNISQLKSGVYFLTVKTERKTFTQKIIKQ